MHHRRVNVRAIVFKNGKLLAQTFKTPEGETAWWGTPGGGLELGESLHQGLHREMIEETGIAPVIGKLLFIQQFDDGTKEQLEFFFHVENPEDYETVDLAATTHGLLENVRCEFIDPKTTQILPTFLQTIDIQNAITSSQAVFITSEL